MRTIYKVKKSVIILFACFIVACGAETLAIIFLPAFAATWPDANDPLHSVSLQPKGENVNVESGVFTGEEFYDDNASNKKGLLSGSFNGLDIEFTVVRQTGGNVKFTGTMTPVSDTDHSITRIVLTSSEGDLVLGQ